MPDSFANIVHVILNCLLQLSPNNFSLCVVTVKSDFETVLSDTSNPSQNFFYHRLDLETVPGECEYLSATATIGMYITSFLLPLAKQNSFQITVLFS